MPSPPSLPPNPKETKMAHLAHHVVAHGVLGGRGQQGLLGRGRGRLALLLGRVGRAREQAAARLGGGHRGTHVQGSRGESCQREKKRQVTAKAHLRRLFLEKATVTD